MQAVIYARVSSDSQDVDLSISAQMKALKAYALKNGYEILREYIDEAESGRSAARPAFKEMIALARAKNPPFDTILVWKLNRFARSRVDSITYKKLLKDRGIRLISINEPLDDSPSGHLLEGVIETIDEFYSENLGQDIRRGMRENAERGFFNGSRPPYAFKRMPVQDGSKTRYKLEPESEDSVAVQVVRRMFDLALRGIGCKEIAKTLNNEGIRTSTGHRWGKTTVHKVLNNEAYCGTLVWGGRPGHPAIHSSVPPVRTENAWPAIINKETFNLIQKKMTLKAPIEIHPRVVPSFYLLSGLLFCPCGHAMIGRSAKSHQYYYYMCNRVNKQGRDTCGARSLPKDKLEHLVIEQIKEKILTEEWSGELVELVNGELDVTSGELKDRLRVIDAELDDISKRLSRNYDALETGSFALSDLAPRIKELRVRQEQLNKTRVQIEAELILQGKPYIDISLVRSYAEDLKSLLEDSDFTESKAFLRSFVKKIVVDGEKATIYYKLPVPPDGKRSESLGVLPIVTPGGPQCTIRRTFELSFSLIS